VAALHPFAPGTAIANRFDTQDVHWDAVAVSRPGFSRWGEDGAGGEPAGRRALRLALVIAAHAVLLAAALTLIARPDVVGDVERVYVRLIETPAPIQAPPATPKSLPTARPTSVRQSEPPPTLAAAADAAPTAGFAVPPPPPAPAATAAVTAVAAVTEASFDADYLHNPKPVYPNIARRLGQEGQVMLRVHVGADGNALVVEIGRTSGFASLDNAARDAVQHWRFVPARRGDAPIDAWVGVPITFRLDH